MTIVDDFRCFFCSFPYLDGMGLGKEKKAFLKARYDLLDAALSRLSPKHKIIYLTYKQYEAMTEEGYKLPRQLLKALRDELELTQSTIRVYKNEVFEEVEAYLRIYGSK